MPVSAQSKAVLIQRVQEAKVDGHRFLVSCVDDGPKTAIFRIPYPLLDSPLPLESRFKAALIQSGIPPEIRGGISWFGVDKKATASGRKRRLIQFKATEPAARYLVEELKCKLFFEDDCYKIEYEGLRLNSLETVKFGWHAIPPNQTVPRQ